MQVWAGAQGRELAHGRQRASSTPPSAAAGEFPLVHRRTKQRGREPGDGASGAGGTSKGSFAWWWWGETVHPKRCSLEEQGALEGDDVEGQGQGQGHREPQEGGLGVVGGVEEGGLQGTGGAQEGQQTSFP